MEQITIFLDDLEGSSLDDYIDFLLDELEQEKEQEQEIDYELEYIFSTLGDL